MALGFGPPAATPPADWIVSVDRRFAIPVNEIVIGALAEEYRD